MAQQVKTITSEALESAYRSLTPSQDGFTEDLMASNTIIPVLDLTASAEGTTTPELLQTALAFGSVTAFNARNSTATIANTAGFYRVFGAYSNSTNAGTVTADIRMSDGLTNKIIYAFVREGGGGSQSQSFDFVVFLRSGDSISANTNDTSVQIAGCSRQIADVNGNLVQPSGFTPQ